MNYYQELDEEYTVIPPTEPFYTSIATYENCGIQPTGSNQYMNSDSVYTIQSLFTEHGLGNAVPFIMQTGNGHIVCYRIDYYHPLEQTVKEMSVYHPVLIGSIYKPLLISNHPLVFVPVMQSLG